MMDAGKAWVSRGTAEGGSRPESDDPGAVQPPTISVVICTYTGGRWHQLHDAVESVAAQTRPPLDIVVVVDHDPSLLRRVLAELPSVVGVRNGEARGLSGARNSGIKLARGDVVAFLDDDAVAGPDWLEQLAQPYMENTVLGVGGAIVPVWRRRPRWFPAEFEWVVGCTYRGMPVASSTVRNVIGANMSFRRSLFAELGGFRSGIGRIGTRPFGCEETEFCIRVSREHPRGVFLYEPRARVRHHVPERRASWQYFLSRCYAEGLSKAQVVRTVGANRGLSAERNYALRALPSGFFTGLVDAVTLRDPAGVLRSAAIAIGLVTATIGFGLGLIRGIVGTKPALSGTSGARAGA
jgi:GT2 family glycosyltransferase